MPTNKEIFNAKMTALADSINAKSGSSGAKGIDGMKAAVDNIPDVGRDGDGGRYTVGQNGVRQRRKAYGHDTDKNGRRSFGFRRRRYGARRILRGSG